MDQTRDCEAHELSSRARCECDLCACGTYLCSNSGWHLAPCSQGSASVSGAARCSRQPELLELGLVVPFRLIPLPLVLRCLHRRRRPLAHLARRARRGPASSLLLPCGRDSRLAVLAPRRASTALIGDPFALRLFKAANKILSKEHKQLFSFSTKVWT